MDKDLSEEKIQIQTNKAINRSLLTDTVHTREETLKSYLNSAKASLIQYNHSTTDKSQDSVLYSAYNIEDKKLECSVAFAQLPRATTQVNEFVFRVFNFLVTKVVASVDEFIAHGLKLSIKELKTHLSGEYTTAKSSLIKHYLEISTPMLNASCNILVNFAINPSASYGFWHIVTKETEAGYFELGYLRSNSTQQKEIELAHRAILTLLKQLEENHQYITVNKEIWQNLKKEELYIFVELMTLIRANRKNSLSRYTISLTTLLARIPALRQPKKESKNQYRHVAKIVKAIIKIDQVSCAVKGTNYMRVRLNQEVTARNFNETKVIIYGEVLTETRNNKIKS